MKYAPIFAGLLFMFLGGTDQVFAQAETPECRASMEKLRKARTAVADQKRIVNQAQSKKLRAQANLESCAPGQVVTGSRLALCTQSKQHWPIAVQEVLDAQAELDKVQLEFSNQVERMNRVCLPEG